MALDNYPIAHANTGALQSLHSWVHDPQVMQKIYKQYGNGFLYFDILRSLNRVTPIASEELITAERPYMHRTITLGSTVTVVNDNEMTFDLDANDIDSLGYYYPRLYFNVLFGDTGTGFTHATITDITGGVFTVTRTDSNSVSFTDLDAAGLVSTGQEVAIGDSSFAGETDQPDPTSCGVFKRTHYTQIMKEALKFGGQELARSSHWIDLEGGKWYNMELARPEFLLDLQHEVAAIIGQENNRSLTQVSAIDGSNRPVYKNKGIYTWANELGGEVNYTGVAGFELTDFDSVATYLKSKGITEDIVLVLAGNKLLMDIESAAVDYVKGTSGGLNYTFTDAYGDGMLSGKPNILLNIGFKAIKRGGILFLLFPMNIFDNPYLLGINAYMLNQAALVVPITNVKDELTGELIPNVSARYRGLEDYSRERIVGTFPGMDGFAQQKFGLPSVSTIDGNTTGWLSEMMYPVVEAFKLMIIKRTS